MRRWVAMRALVLAAFVAAAACNPTSPLVHHDQSEIPGPRTDAASAVDTVNRTIVMFGGADRSGVLDETWTWDGAAWHRQHPASSPSAREFAYMGFDPTSSRIVLFGGTTCAPPAVPDPTGCEYQKAQTNLNDTWMWDGATWSQLHTAHSPSIQGFRGDFGGIAADEGNRDLMLVTWPTNSDTSTVETWTLRDGDWVLLHPKHRPGAYEFSGPAYDAVSGHVVLQQQGERLSVTSWWDGSDWNLFDLSVKTPHSYGRLVEAGSSGLLLIWFNDVYAWNGKIWSPLALLPSSVSSPDHARDGWTASYFEATHELVLFGGRDSSGGPDLRGDTVGWDGTSWKTLVVSQVTRVGQLSACSAQQSLSGMGSPQGGQISDPSGAVVELEFSEPPSGPCHLHVDITMSVHLGNDLVTMPGNPATQAVDFDLVAGGGGIAADFDAHGVCALGGGVTAHFEGGDFKGDWDLTGYSGCSVSSPAPLSITTSVRRIR